MPQVPIKRTPIDAKTYAKAVLAACTELGWEPLTKQAVGVLWAQFMIETGGKACWNWNIGNVKATQGMVDADWDWIDLPGTWEVIHGKRVVLPDGDPGRRFRAFSSLAEAMVAHLGFLRNRRYKTAWPSVEAGDCDGFARRLKAAGYYTAPADAYARGMLAHWRRYMASDVFEAVKASEAPTLPALPEDEEDTPTVNFQRIHPDVPVRGFEEPPPDDDDAA